MPAIPFAQVSRPAAVDSGEESDTSSSGLDDDAFDDTFFGMCTIVNDGGNNVGVGDGGDGLTEEMKERLDAEVAQFERTLYYHSSHSPQQQTRATVPLPHFAALTLKKSS